MHIGFWIVIFVSCFFVLFSVCSFGNAALDERSILAPLYQCCMWVNLWLIHSLFVTFLLIYYIYLIISLVRVRVSTWNRINLLRGGALSSAMRQALAFDPIHPVLAEPHLAALDRRLSGVIATVKQCMEAQGPDNTLIEDRMNLPHP